MPAPKKYDQFAVPFVPGEPTIPLPAPLSNLGLPAGVYTATTKSEANTL